MRPAIDAVRETGTAVAEVAMSYTGDLSDPAENLYTLDYYLKLAEQIVDAGAHVLAIKDMAGLLRAPAANTLVTALKSRFDLPVHVHTHDTPGGQLATYVAAWQAGADAVDGASAPMAGTTSQPALSSIVAAAAHTEYDTGLSLSAVCDLEPYWEALRKVYAPFESGSAGADRPGLHPRDSGRAVVQPAPAGHRAGAGRPVRGHRGQLCRRRPGAGPVGEGDARRPRWSAIWRWRWSAPGVSADEFAADPARYDIPDSVIGFLRGELGDPPGGWPEPLRTKALQGRAPAKPEQELSAEDEAVLAEPGAERQATLNRLLFPGPTKEFEAHRDDLR